MAVVTPSSLAELQTLTLAHYERTRFTEIATSLREYHVFPNLVLFGEEKAKAAGKAARMETRKAGTSIDFRAMVNHSGASRHVGMATPDDPVKVDTMVSATVPWRNTTTQWGMLQQELSMNSAEPEKIVDLYTVQDKAALISLAVLMENTFWGSPVDSTDEVTPYGVFTWFAKGSTQGFNGAFPSGFTTLGLSTEHANWKHYVDQYTNFTKDDALFKMFLACERTKFKNPVAGIPNLDQALDRAIYMNTSTYITYVQYLQTANDDIGFDATYANGQAMFSNAPVMTVPKLDDDTTNPIIGLDWGTMKCIALADWWLRRFVQKNYPGQHTTDAYFIDSTYNFVCWNRRKNWVMATGTTYPS